MKKGISLTVLVITIIVMIILATAVIISISNANVISKAGEAVDKTTLENMQEQANIKISEILSDRSKSQTMTSSQIEAAVKADLKETYKDKADNVNIEYEDGVVTVTPVTNASSADWNVQINQTTGYGTVVGYTGNGGSVTIPSNVNINGKEVKIKYVDLVGMDMAQMQADAGEDGVTIEYLRDEKYSIAEYNSITSLTISEGIEEVSIFGCIKMENITLPSTLKKITCMAFNYALKKVNIPEGTTTIGEMCFAFDEKLTEVTFPTTITSFGAVAFNETLWLYNQPDGPIYAGNVFITSKGDMEPTSTFEIKSGTTVIAGGAFSGDRGNEVNIDNGNTIATLILPNTLQYIGEEAFERLTVTNGFTIPSGVVSIARQAFYHADLTAITIPASVEYIGAFAFANIGGAGTDRQINITVNKTERECDTFDTAWSCTKINNLSEQHTVTYQAE
jgi:hypothetical protein